MPKFTDLTDQVFDRLTVRELAGRKGNHIMWKCDCSCGNAKVVAGDALLSGNTKSCGCLFRQTMTTHGQYKDPVYAVWGAMLSRCSNPNHRDWARYGGRGITVCPEWKSSYATFAADMGPRPDKLTLERRNNDSGYNPHNCYWGTRGQQMRNTSRTRLVTIGGVSKPLIDWCSTLGLNKATVATRIHRGWSPLRALTEPTKPDLEPAVESAAEHNDQNDDQQDQR